MWISRKQRVILTLFPITVVIKSPCLANMRVKDLENNHINAGQVMCVYVCIYMYVFGMKNCYIL